MGRLATLALGVALVSGCATPMASLVVRDPKFSYPATQAGTVTVSTDPPVAEYEVVGEVRGRISAAIPTERIERALREEAAAIGGHGVVVVIQERETERKIPRPMTTPQPGVGVPGTPVATLPGQTGRLEEITVLVPEKEITGVVIRLKK